MVFSSSIFLIYFLPVLLLLYFLANKKYKNPIALAGSVIFCMWGAPFFILVILGTVLFNFLFALGIHSAERGFRKALLICAVCLNIGILIYFQYTGFLSENINALLGIKLIGEMKWMKVVMPLGISFITFHQLSYLIDIYRGDDPPMRSLWNYALFILYFPQLISGPIIRLHEMSDQIKDRGQQYNVDNQLLGFVRFITGLSKKVLIANVLGAEADRIFAMTGVELTTPLAWIGILAYTFQIYFDFSGYSDMAIGLARMMGFIFPENFNNPYISQSITEFWRRWHMTLSAWLRDYLFTPLSLSMRRWRIAGLIISLLLTFTLCGMWHKPGWNFIIWGAYHGTLLIADRLFLLKILKKIGRIPSIIFTFFLTLIGWVLFRGDTLHHIGVYLKRMFIYKNNTAEWGLKTDFWVILAIAALFSFIVAFKFGERLQFAVFEKVYSIKRLLIFGSISVLLFIICVGSITGSGFNPFIYFRF
jgi:alginate O-acetyltransferase complex protein AlgI